MSKNEVPPQRSEKQGERNEQVEKESMAKAVREAGDASKAVTPQAIEDQRNVYRDPKKATEALKNASPDNPQFQQLCEKGSAAQIKTALGENQQQLATVAATIQECTKQVSQATTMDKFGSSEK